MSLNENQCKGGFVRKIVLDLGLLGLMLRSMSHVLFVAYIRHL